MYHKLSVDARLLYCLRGCTVLKCAICHVQNFLLKEIVCLLNHVVTVFIFIFYAVDVGGLLFIGYSSLLMSHSFVISH
jgi:LSD1 subclass zinc finger protein